LHGESHNNLLQEMRPEGLEAANFTN